MNERAPFKKFWAYETAQAALAAMLLGALLVRAGPLHQATVTVAVILILQVGGALILRKQESLLLQKLRLANAYAVGLALFSAVAVVIPALQFAPVDSELLAIDRALFGETPSILLAPFANPWLTEVFSAFYLSYHLYFHGVLGYALLQPIEQGRRIFEYMFVALPAGILGYVLVPALGPVKALASEFEQPLVGGWLTSLNNEIVNRGSAVFDVFPSLHIFMTCVILDHDRTEHPRRFKWMLPVALGLFASTIYLRYHYAIDLIAGGVWFLALRSWWKLRERRLRAPGRVVEMELQT